MKKVLMILFSFLVVSSSVFANPSIQPNPATLDKNDARYLFDDGANMVVLDQAEMERTEGKFWPIIFALTFGWASKTYLNAPTNGGWIYSNWPYQRRTWIPWGGYGY